jgi:hypothetical protein
VMCLVTGLLQHDLSGVLGLAGRYRPMVRSGPMLD